VLCSSVQEGMEYDMVNQLLVNGKKQELCGIHKAREKYLYRKPHM
jgi:hypothetical protein